MQNSTYEVVRVDPFDDVAFRAWFDAREAGMAAGRIAPPPRAFVEQLVHYQTSSQTCTLQPFVAVERDVVVGAGNLELPLRDNRTLAMFDLAVPPERRGRGVGAALLAYVLDQAREEARTSLLTEVFAPRGTVLADWPGVRFADRHGFTTRITEIRRQLRLPVDRERLEALAAEAAEKASDYQLVAWAGPCPVEYAEQYAYLKGLIMAEAPTGELDYEPERWDVARLREEEDLAVSQGRSLYTCVALAPDGTLAGHTQIAASRHQPEWAFQWDTLVLRTHRGRRLGLALKVANLQAVTAAQPQVERITTWNAEENGPMIAVNEALGFEIVELLQERQRDL
ncbi:GNAT family N-acetyltransferase [Actinopolymorpha sp. B9G3]|uniref:GNAT family N-acetyltransferase n=1 Tax=Actinopolymorpha sp. B9G3 TaxID=3158970 RepID=UPI0032D970CC